VLDVQFTEHFRKDARHDQAVFQRVASPRRGLRAIADSPPATVWGPREIDLDLLLYGRSKVRTARLTIPHRELVRRKFVLEPLCDLAPGLRPPGSRRTVRQLLRALTEPDQKVSLYRR
jgi:hypothetical protein